MLLNLSSRFGLLHGLALVVLFAAPADPQQDLGSASLEVDPKRNQGQSLLVGLAGEAADLAAMQEQLSRPARIMVEAVGLDVLGDVAADQPDLAVLHPAVGLLKRDLARTQALHLAADQADAALQRVEHREIVSRLAILGNRPLAVTILGGGSPLPLLLLGRDKTPCSVLTGLLQSRISGAVLPHFSTRNKDLRRGN